MAEIFKLLRLRKSVEAYTFSTDYRAIEGAIFSGKQQFTRLSLEFLGAFFFCSKKMLGAMPKRVINLQQSDVWYPFVVVSMLTTKQKTLVGGARTHREFCKVIVTVGQKPI